MEKNICMCIECWMIVIVWTVIFCRWLLISYGGYRNFAIAIMNRKGEFQFIFYIVIEIILELKITYWLEVLSTFFFRFRLGTLIFKIQFSLVEWINFEFFLLYSKLCIMLDKFVLYYFVNSLLKITFGWSFFLIEWIGLLGWFSFHIFNVFFSDHDVSNICNRKRGSRAGKIVKNYQQGG